MIIQQIQTVLDDGYELNFSDIFNKSFENFKKTALISGLIFILMSVVFAVIGIGVFSSFYALSSFTDLLTNFNVLNFSIAGTIIYVLSAALVSGLIAPLYAGIIKIADLANKNQDFGIATSFEYYQSKYFVQLFLSTFLISIVTTTISTILQLLGYQIIGVLIVYIISFFTFLHIPLIIFGNLTAIESIQASILTVKHQILILLALLIVAFLFVCLGIFAFCIGIFFTFPFIF